MFFKVYDTYFLSLPLRILHIFKINTNFIDLQMIFLLFLDISTGFRFAKKRTELDVEESTLIHIGIS